MIEAVLPVVVIGFLVLVHCWIDTGRLGYGVAACGVAAFSSWVHVRGMILIGAFALVLCVAWRDRWVGRGDVGVMAGALAAVASAGLVLNGWVKSQLYPGGT